MKPAQQPTTKVMSTATASTASASVSMGLNALPEKIVKFFGSIVVILLACHITGHLLHDALPGRHFSVAIMRRFGLGFDANIPTLFSVVLLFSSAALLYVLYRYELVRGFKTKARYWLLLSFIFIFLGFDEGTRIHEFWIGFVKARLGKDAHGMFMNAWVVPYALAVLLLGIFFLRFVFSLPPRTRNLIIIAGGIYVGGALGFELLEGAEETKNGMNTTVLAMQTVEEVMEMSGVITFIYALLDYLRPGILRLTLTPNRKSASV